MKKLSLPTVFIILILLQTISNAQNLHNKIVFSTYGMPDDSIWSMNGDGSGKKFITLGNCPRVSPDKHYMAFLRGGNVTKSRNSLYLRDLNAKHDTLIFGSYDYIVNYDFNTSSTALTFDFSCNIYRIDLSTGVVSAPLVSVGDCWDDAPRIFEEDSSITFQNLHYGIYTVNYDGSDPVLIPNTQHGDLSPAWSPDKTWIYFTRDYENADYVPHNYFKIHPDGSDLVALTNFPDGDTLGFYGTCTKDGKYIVTAARINGVVGIYQIATNGYGTPGLIAPLSTLFAATTLAVGNADTVTDIETGLNEVSFSSAIKISPNPASDIATISVNLKNPSTIKLILYNDCGKEIQVFDEWSGVGNHSFQLDLHSIPSGIYWCTLLAGNKNYAVKFAVSH